MATETFQTVAGKPTIVKDPQAELDYNLDLTAWLAVSGDTLAAATAVGTGVTVDDVDVVDAGRQVKVWLSGGTAGTTATVTITFTTTSTPPRVDERTLYFKIKQR